MKSLRQAVQSERNGRTRGAQIVAGLVALLAASPLQAQVSQEEPPGPRAAAKILADVEACVLERAFVPGYDFSDVGERLSVVQDEIAAASSTGEFVRTINGALATYGISHLMVYDPKMTALARRGSEVGAGFRAMPVDRGERLVTLVQAGGPADTMGLETGDLVTHIDGSPLARSASPLYPFSRGGRLLPAELPTRNITWSRGGVAKEGVLRYGVHARSQPVSIRWEQAGVAPANGDDDQKDGSPSGAGPGARIAWLTVRGFQDYPTEEIERSFAEIKERRATGLVLDLRSNGGGPSNNHLHLASLLVPSATPLYRSIEASTELVSSDLSESGDLVLVPETPKANALRFSGPVVILMNGINGSGGELFPAFMRQARDAILVGTRTNGAVLGGIYCGIRKGFKVLLPVQEVILLSGHRIEGNGVEPDVILSPAHTADEERLRETVQEILSRRSVHKE